MIIEVEHRLVDGVWQAGDKASPTGWKGATSARRWTFYAIASHGFGDLVLKLEGFTELGRATPRHKFKPQRMWARGSRDYSLRWIDVSEVPVPLSVQHAAADKIVVVFVPEAGMKRAEQAPLGGRLSK